jgi:hypothetical protein
MQDAVVLNRKSGHMSRIECQCILPGTA